LQPLSSSLACLSLSTAQYLNQSTITAADEDTIKDDEVVVFHLVPPPPRQTFEEMVEQHQAFGAGEPGDDQEQPTQVQEEPRPDDS
jgi:hypothetical protein